MIYLMSQVQADRERVDPKVVQSISPYQNPGHVLAPPRRWLEALIRSEYNWHFFRLRYKNMLRNRFREEPERFFSLLDGSEGEKPLVLTCHCLAGGCHRELAKEFLESLRDNLAHHAA